MNYYVKITAKLNPIIQLRYYLFIINVMYLITRVG